MPGLGQTVGQMFYYSVFSALFYYSVFPAKDAVHRCGERSDKILKIYIKGLDLKNDSELEEKKNVN